MNVLRTWFEIHLLLQVMPFTGNQEGWKFSRMCFWLLLFPWVNSLNSLRLSFFFCNVGVLRELLSKGEDILRFLEHKKLRWLPNIRLLHHLLWKNNQGKVSKYRNLFMEVPPFGPLCWKGETSHPKPASFLGWPCASLPAPVSALVGLFPAWISSQTLNDQKWFSRKKNTWKSLCFLPFCI